MNEYIEAQLNLYVEREAWRIVVELILFIKDTCWTCAYKTLITYFTDH